MKINLSRIFRYVLITLINISAIFVFQYYINLQTNISVSLSNLKVAIFIDNSNSNIGNEEDKDDSISKIFSYTKFLNTELIDSGNFEKFTEINPELDNIIPKESISFPTFILANLKDINNLEELENVKNEILSFENVEDFVYDQKAYKMFFDNKELLNNYKNIFKVIFYIIIFLFVLKVLFFVIKELYKDIIFEIGSGILLGFSAYMIICLITVFSQSSVFVLNWQILYVVIPLSLIVTLLTKESNA